MEGINWISLFFLHVQCYKPAAQHEEGLCRGLLPGVQVEKPQGERALERNEVSYMGGVCCPPQPLSLSQDYLLDLQNGFHCVMGVGLAFICYQRHDDEQREGDGWRFGFGSVYRLF